MVAALRWLALKSLAFPGVCRQGPLLWVLAQLALGHQMLGALRPAGKALFRPVVGGEQVDSA